MRSGSLPRSALLRVRCNVARMSYGFQVTFDAADPMRLAEFWALALGYILQPPPPGFDSWEAFADSIDMPPEDREGIAAIVDPDGARPRLLFLKVPEEKTAKNRVHLDVNVGEREMDEGDRAAVRRAKVTELRQAGATVVEDRADFTSSWTVMLDPEGNEFCVQ